MTLPAEFLRNLTTNDSVYIDNLDDKLKFSELHRKQPDLDENERTLYLLFAQLIFVKKLEAEHQGSLRKMEARNFTSIVSEPASSPNPEAPSDSRACCVFGIICAALVILGVALMVLNFMFLMWAPLITLSAALIVNGAFGVGVSCFCS